MIIISILSRNFLIFSVGFGVFQVKKVEISAKRLEKLVADERRLDWMSDRINNGAWFDRLLPMFV